MVKKELSHTVKLSIFPALGSDQKIEAAQMRFLQMLAGLSLRDKERSSDIRGELRVEPLLLGGEGRRCLIRMPLGSLSLEVFWPRPTRGRPRARPRIAYPSWPGNALGSLGRRWKALQVKRMPGTP